MRQFGLKIWHLLLVTLIVVSSLVGVLAGVRVFLSEWEHPWLLPLLALVAVDAVITQWLVERERQSWLEQIAIRSVEATLLVVATRIASLAAEGSPLSVMTTWLRDPLAFLGGRFTEYLLLVAVTWIVSTWLVHRVIELDAAPPPPTVREQVIDQEVLLNERTLALMRFDKLWIFLLGLGLSGVVLALYRTPLLQVIGTWSSLQLLLALLVCALAGVLLHSEGHLNHVRFRWQIDQLDVTPAVTQRWRRTSWLMIVGAIGLALLLGGLVSNVPAPPPLAPVLNILMVVLILATWLVVVVVGLLVFPFIWLLSLFRGEGSAEPMRFEPPPLPPVQQLSGERPLLPALIFWGCVALLVGIAVLRYVQQREDVRALLGRWRGWRWLMQFWGSVVDDLRGWSDLALQKLQRLRGPRRPARARRKSARGERAQIRALYRRMVRLASHRGVTYRTSQTPYEFSRTLEAAVPLIDDEAHALTDAFVASEYGPQSPSKSEVRQVQKLWRRIERALLRRR